MVTSCTKMETTIKLNFTMINLILNVVVNVTKYGVKNFVAFTFIKFFSIYLRCVNCLYFGKQHSFLLAMHLQFLKF